MKTLTLFLGFVCAGLFAEDLIEVKIGEMNSLLPQNWVATQQFQHGSTQVVLLSKGDESVFLYVVPETPLDMKAVFANGTTVTQNVTQELIGALKWDVLVTKKSTPASPQVPAAAVFVKAFKTNHHGFTYYGYGKSKVEENAKSNVEEILKSLLFIPVRDEDRSLTGNDFHGIKYYLGWGRAGGDDPAKMHNEVKYDVKHTHEIFTKDVGGNYQGTQLIAQQASAQNIRNEWKKLKDQVTDQDMYLQYSSGHGNQTGLGVGVNYNEIRDAALSLKAKEVVIFIMACHSGGLVNAFNAKKAEWEKWKDQGRSLLVMASSTVAQKSSIGPGKDPKEPQGPSGSAGSAFGHALWKSLIGEADGYIDGVKDGFVSLGEIRDYATWKTKKVGGHSPVVTGAYHPEVIMNRIPSREWVERMEAEGGTGGLSDGEVVCMVQDLDKEMRVEGSHSIN